MPSVFGSALVHVAANFAAVGTGGWDDPPPLPLPTPLVGGLALGLAGDGWEECGGAGAPGSGGTTTTGGAPADGLWVGAATVGGDAAGDGPEERKSVTAEPGAANWLRRGSVSTTVPRGAVASAR